MYILTNAIVLTVFTRASTVSPSKADQDAIRSSIGKFQHTFAMVKRYLQGKKCHVSVPTTKTTLVFSLENAACSLLYRNLRTSRTTQVKSTIQEQFRTEMVKSTKKKKNQPKKKKKKKQVEF